MKNRFIDAVSFLPGLDIKDDNFHFFIEDAWDIVFGEGVYEYRYRKNTQENLLSDREEGNILLWVLSFLELYNEFHDRKRDIPHTYMNFIEQVENTFEGKSIIIEYLRKESRINLSRDISSKKLNKIIKNIVLYRKELIKIEISNYVVERIGETIEYSYRISYLISAFTCVHWLSRFTNLNSEEYFKAYNKEHEESCYQIEEISRNSYDIISKMALPYSISLKLNFKEIKKLGPMVYGNNIITPRNKKDSGYFEELIYEDDYMLFEEKYKEEFKTYDRLYKWFKSWGS